MYYLLTISRQSSINQGVTFFVPTEANEWPCLSDVMIVFVELIGKLMLFPVLGYLDGQNGLCIPTNFIVICFLL